MTNPLRDKLEKSTKEIFGSLKDLPGKPIWEVFGTITAPKSGASNWYDTSAFYATTNVHFGDNYEYVYNQGNLQSKPAKFHRLTAGVKLTEEQMELDQEDLVAHVENKAQKQERGLRAKADYEFNGYAADVAGTGSGWGALRLGAAAAAETIVDPRDCNTTSGTVENLATVNFTGAGKSAEPLNATIGVAQRAIGTAVLDAETGESILRNDGTDTFILWCHPRMAGILRTNKEIKIAAAELESRTYAQILKEDWNTEIQPTMALGVCTGQVDATSVMVLTANTKENFFILPIEKPHWTPWKDIDDGEKISYVKRFKAGLGALPRVFIDNDNVPFKAMFAMSITPNGA